MCRHITSETRREVRSQFGTVGNAWGWLELRLTSTYLVEAARPVAWQIAGAM